MLIRLRLENADQALADAANFHSQYMKTRRLPRDLGRMFVNAFDNRSQSDYQDDLTVSLDDVAASLEDAERFVAELKEFLKADN